MYAMRNEGLAGCSSFILLIYRIKFMIYNYTRLVCRQLDLLPMIEIRIGSVDARDFCLY